MSDSPAVLDADLDPFKKEKELTPITPIKDQTDTENGSQKEAEDAPQEDEMVDMFDEESKMDFFQKGSDLLTEDYARYKAEDEKFAAIVDQCLPFIQGRRDLAEDLTKFKRGALVFRFVNISELQGFLAKLQAHEKAEKTRHFHYKKLKNVIKAHVIFYPVKLLSEINDNRRGRDVYMRKLYCYADGLDPKDRLLVNFEAFPTSVDAGRFGILVHASVQPINTTMTTTGPSKKKKACSACHKNNLDTKRCSRCDMAHYCSKACQKDHWMEHRFICFDAKITQAPVPVPHTEVPVPHADPPKTH